MRGFIFCLLAFIPTFCFAQTFTFDLWHDGKVVLDNGDTIKGSVKYGLDDLLQFRHDNRIESFAARKVLLFEIFDQSYKRYRQFYSLPYSATGGYKSPVFFEVLSEGKITLLSREKVELRNNSYSPYGSPFYSPYGYGGYGTRKVLVNIYFILKDNGNIEPVADKRSSWLDLMGSRADAVHDYAKENRLDFAKKYDLKQIIDYYNSLK
jgi:hypothetical protein